MVGHMFRGYEMKCQDRTLPASFQRYLGKRYVVPDLYDAAANLDVEYMSDQEHLESERKNQDSKRRNVLEQMGVHVIEVWNEDMKNAVAFERIVEEVKRGLAIRYRMSSPALLERRQRLMNELRCDTLAREMRNDIGCRAHLAGWHAKRPLAARGGAESAIRPSACQTAIGGNRAAGDGHWRDGTPNGH